MKKAFSNVNNVINVLHIGKIEEDILGFSMKMSDFVVTSAKENLQDQTILKITMIKCMEKNQNKKIDFN